MNKCYKCGQEFDGTFCPNCGTKYEAEKTCPDCGAMLNGSVNFCNHCGHRFETQDNSVNNVKAQAPRSQTVKNSFGKFFNTVKNWCASHKKVVIGTSAGILSLIVVCVLVFAVIVPLATNIFREGKLTKVNIGDDKEQVVKVLGNPYGGDTAGSTWEYYGSEFLTLFKQKEDLDRRTEELEDIDDFAALEKLMQEELALEEKLENTIGRRIVVSFNSDSQVTSLTYDASYSKSNATAAKEVKSIDIGSGNTVDVVDIANNRVNVRVSYTDGSYRLTGLTSSIKPSDFGATAKNFPSSATLTWRDSWGEYSQIVKMDESNYNFDWSYSNGTLSLDGTIPTKTLMNFFDMELPWIDKDVNTISIGAATAYMPDLADVVKDISALKSIDVSEHNKDLYVVSNVLVDFNLHKVVFAPDGVNVSTDDKGNVFVTSGNSLPKLILSLSTTNELVLPYYNDGSYTVSSDLAKNYTKVTFDQSDLWTSIPVAFLRACSTLTDITLPENITAIGGSAFNDCRKLKSIVIPDGVTIIGEGTFYNCSDLTNLTIPSGVTSIGYNAFYNCHGLTSITVDSNNTKYRSSGNCLIETATKTLILGCSKSVIPNDGTVSIIGDSAFYDCSLTNIIIPDGVTSIGNYAFYHCGLLASITIPDGVTSIGDSAFYECRNLQSITISGSVTTIGDYAFNWCLSLKTINFDGTVSQWNAITKGMGWNLHVPAKQVICSDGEVTL